MESFTEFVRWLLDKMEPFPAPNSVIVMDNCSIHKHPNIQALVESKYVFNYLIFLCADRWSLCRGMWCEFLLPYSPDLNPTKLAFSAMKYHLRRNGEYARLAMTQLTEPEIYITLLDALYNHSWGLVQLVCTLWICMIVPSSYKPMTFLVNMHSCFFVVAHNELYHSPSPNPFDSWPRSRPHMTWVIKHELAMCN